MKNINEVKDCYGCFACLSKCPKQCISIKKDKIGHLYPHANENCIKCNACLKVCPSINKIKLNTPLFVYAATGKDYKIIENSSSGGIATILSQEFISSGGIVYGCASKKNFIFKHIRCENLEELESLKGSKYVQSDISEVYSLINEDLKCNKKVLFIGTPCQVAAIKTYFKNNILLYTVDLICHGVPSIQILKDSIPNNFKTDVHSISFRDKKIYQIKLYQNSKIIYTRPLNKDLYLKGFFTSIFNRESCFSCKYATSNRVSDITLGDFWGLEKKFFYKGGGSLCIINTINGESLYCKINDKIYSSLESIEKAQKGNEPLNKPPHKTLKVKIFQTLYPIFGFKLSVFFAIPQIVIKNFILNIIK